MRFEAGLIAAACALLAASAATAVVALAPAHVSANDETAAAQDRPENQNPPETIAEVRPELEQRDEWAALEAIEIALSEVGDGASYVWHAHSGRLSGVVRPTNAYKEPGGRICRHIAVSLSVGGFTRETAGVACRLASGVWQLEG